MKDGDQDLFIISQRDKYLLIGFVLSCMGVVGLAYAIS
jgi:hypothetical protein